jgi:hypothetical protein
MLGSNTPGLGPASSSNNSSSFNSSSSSGMMVAPSEGPSEAFSQAGSELQQAVLWGTNIAVRDAMTKFRRFLTEFRMEGEEDEEEAYYMRLLVEIRSSETYNINIDCQNLYNFPPTRRLYDQLVRYVASFYFFLFLLFFFFFISFHNNVRVLSAILFFFSPTVIHKKLYRLWILWFIRNIRIYLDRTHW